MPFAAYARAFSLPQKSYSDHIRELHYRIETAQEKMERKSKPGDFSQQSNHRRRDPLGDGTATANVNKFKSKSDQKEKSPIKPDNSVPMNESLVANRTVAARHTTNSPKNQHISQISSAAPSDSKRNSFISTTSTNASGTGRKRKTHIGPWQLGSTVGKGGTARVRKVRHAMTGQIGVAKIIPVAMAERARAISLANLVHSAERGDPTLHFDKAMPLGLEREIAIMKLLDHPNIVKLYDVWENKNEIYLIMEYVQGAELFEYVADRQRLQEDVTVYLFRQMIWALKYCHGLNIHHRDLKPENILLDYETMTVKLVDFGMAALQPEGNYLTTPCGSPHYAAPELLCNRPYDGSQADVWSAGVVLFVMLTGYPPFNFPVDPHGVVPKDHKLKGLFQAITRAEYRMPGALSRDAQDLIRKIFIPDPSKRITIDEVWDHPFLHKYDSMWGMETLTASNSMVALALAEDNWKPLKPRYIDRDIFRALRTLWHSESDTALTEKLCNKNFNQEKFFYHTMLRHREENLENMQSNQHNFGYSASDYQHNKPAIPQPLLPRQAPSLSTKTSKTSKLPRTKSEYSVTGDEHLLSKHSYYELPVSEASYDPFRASRSPIIPLKSDNVNVTVHRLSSKTSKGSKSHVSRASRGGSLRVEMLRAHSRRGSRISSKHSSTSNSAGRRTAEKQSSRSSSSRSRLSLAGSNLPSGSPLPVMRPSEVHKRGVQFSHLRKSSTASALPFIADADLSSRTPDHRARALRKLASGRSSSYINDSPLLPADPIVVRKKGVAVLSAPRTTKEPRDNADLEARKASVELGKAMDEAFWRSSMSSSLHSSPTERPFVDTPPSSISQPSPNAAMKDPFVVTESYRNRPLPPTPMVTISTLHPSETPVTYTTRELAEMRDRLAVKYAREGTGNQKYFNDVLHQLDKLMKPIEARDASSESRRIVSAPPDCHYVQGSVDLTGLDVIPEEGKFTDVEDNGMRRKRSAGRGVNAASSKRGCTGIEGVDATIRVVDPSPTSHPTKAVNLTTTPWAPLNIRKSTSISTKSSATSGSDGMTLPKERVHYHNRATSSLPERRSSFESILANNRLSISGIYLDQSSRAITPILGQVSRDDDRPNTAVPPTIEEVDENTNASADPASVTGIPPLTCGNGRDYEQLDDRTTIRDAHEVGQKSSVIKKFLKAIGKKNAIPLSTAQSREAQATADNAGSSNPAFGDLRAHVTYEGQQDHSSKMLVENFLQGYHGWMRTHFYVPVAMKPALKLIPVYSERPMAWGKVKSEIEKAAGFDIRAENNKKFAMTIKCPAKYFTNLSWSITFDVEVFAISQNQNSDVGISLIRMVQRWGSVDSFAKIGQLIENFMRKQAVLVTDKAEAAEIKAAIFKGLQGVLPPPRTG